MKGQSNVLSTVILTSLLLIVVIAVTGYALWVIEGSVEQAEYVRVKEVAIDLGQAAVTSVCSGYAEVFTLPMRTCGIEFNNTGLVMNISAVINGVYVANYTLGNVIEVLFPCGKYAPKPMSEIIDYGNTSYVVNDALEVPLVTEKYYVSLGRPVIKLNMSRVVAMLKELVINGNISYLLRIYAYNLSYKVVASTNRVSIKCLGIKSEKPIEINVTSGSTIEVVTTLYSDGKILKKSVTRVGSITLPPTLSITTLNISLIIYNVVVEVG